MVIIRYVECLNNIFNIFILYINNILLIYLYRVYIKMLAVYIKYVQSETERLYKYMCSLYEVVYILQTSLLIYVQSICLYEDIHSLHRVHKQST